MLALINLVPRVSLVPFLGAGEGRRETLGTRCKIVKLLNPGSQALRCRCHSVGMRRDMSYLERFNAWFVNNLVSVTLIKLFTCKSRDCGASPTWKAK